VPFFPHEQPLSEVLGRWLAKEQPGMAWVADLVASVNVELIDHLGGPHLLIGPSHFMRKGLDDAAAERIWNYSVYPYIEEQLFGQHDLIATYRWREVLKRCEPAAPAAEPPAAPA
jgi:5-methylcytosine-specific restriction protein B